MALAQQAAVHAAEMQAAQRSLQATDASYIGCGSCGMRGFAGTLLPQVAAPVRKQSDHARAVATTHAHSHRGPSLRCRVPARCSRRHKVSLMKRHAQELLDSVLKNPDVTPERIHRVRLGRRRCTGTGRRGPERGVGDKATGRSHLQGGTAAGRGGCPGSTLAGCSPSAPLPHTLAPPRARS